MTLGTITVPTDKLVGAMPQAPLFALRMSFPGDDSYPTGGTTGFQELVRAAIAAKMAAATDANVRGRQNVEIEAVLPQNCGQYIPSYDKTNDTLFVQDGGSATLAQVGNGTNLSGTTFNVLVVCK
jgi:hypothetical protein